jgi:3-oxoacyl-[acyl-carrier-protein] synthase-3
MPVSAHVVGWGYYLPSRRMDNETLEKQIDTTDEWIQERTGIRERRIAGPHESTATMAVEAAKAALQCSQLDPAKLDLIIVATITPDFIFPATACLVQDAIGATQAAAFDVSAGCSGFVYALALADQAIRAGSARNVLVIGADTLSRFVNWQDRSTCVLFGDGAGAIVLQASELPGGVVGTTWGCDGSGWELLYVPAGGCRQPASAETVSNGLHYLRMNGREVFRFAVGVVPRVTRALLEQLNMDVGDVDLFIPHQANARITAAVARQLGLENERVVDVIDWCGNTSAASIPIALCHAIETGRLKEGDLVVLAGFGAGLTWGAAAIVWDRVPTALPRGWLAFYYRWRYRLAAWRSRLRRQWRRFRDAISMRLHKRWREL